MHEDQICESCGMPMRKVEDFGGGNPDNHYCVYCTDAAGTLKPYAVILENLKNFTLKNLGVSESEALRIAQEGLAGMPAWKGRTNA